MSGANAIHGVVIVGSIIVMLNTEPENILLLVSVSLPLYSEHSMWLGGFVVTDRMLEMFKRKKNKFFAYPLVTRLNFIVMNQKIHSRYYLPDCFCHFRDRIENAQQFLRLPSRKSVGCIWDDARSCRNHCHA